MLAWYSNIYNCMTFFSIARGCFLDNKNREVIKHIKVCEHKMSKMLHFVKFNKIFGVVA